MNIKAYKERQRRDTPVAIQVFWIVMGVGLIIIGMIIFI